MKCLFNGVELPTLPEWDVQAYPYATITLNKTFGLYYLKCFSEAVYYESDGVVYFGGTDENQVGLITSGYATGTDEWGEFQEYESSSIRLVDTDTVALIWTNFNAEYNGVMYMQASEPIPILAPVIDPLSMWLGWKAGNWVARQRGKVKQQWETIFNEQVTFVKSGAMFPEHYIHFGQGNNVLALGDILRVTVDGVLYDLEMEAYAENYIGAGNKYLYDAKSDDNGLDFMIGAYFIGMYEGEAIHYRTEGTHSIKIERRLVE